jgi:hypothetical protein
MSNATTTQPTAKKIDIGAGTWHSLEKAKALAEKLNAAEQGPDGDGWTYKVEVVNHGASGILVAYDENGEALGAL